MAKKPIPEAPAERSRRARPVAELVPSIGGQAFKRFGFTQSAVVERWEEIVGTQYARHSRPEALSFPRGRKDGGTLKVAVTGALAPMLAHVEPQLIERVNRVLGYAAVERLVLRHADFSPTPPAAAARPAARAFCRNTLDAAGHRRPRVARQPRIAGAGAGWQQGAADRPLSAAFQWKSAVSRPCWRSATQRPCALLFRSLALAYA